MCPSVLRRGSEPGLLGVMLATRGEGWFAVLWLYFWSLQLSWGGLAPLPRPPGGECTAVSAKHWGAVMLQGSVQL